MSEHLFFSQAYADMQVNMEQARVITNFADFAMGRKRMESLFAINFVAWKGFDRSHLAAILSF